jgi:hypothetical protein
MFEAFNKIEVQEDKLASARIICMLQWTVINAVYIYGTNGH